MKPIESSGRAGSAASAGDARQSASLQSSLLALVSVVVLLVVAAVMVFFRQGMFSMLRDAETEHVRQLGTTLDFALEEAIQSLRTSAGAWLKEQTVTGARITGSSSILGRDYTLIELPVEPLPEGNRAGLLWYEGESYLACVVSMPGGGAKHMLGVVLDEWRIAELTLDKRAAIIIEAYAGDSFAPGESIYPDPANSARILLVRRFYDLGGKPAQLIMNTPRSIYASGASWVNGTSFFLLLFLLLVLLVLYVVIERRFLSRIARMSEDVRVISGDALLSMDRYNHFTELRTLGQDINALVIRLEANRELAERSESSMEILSNILNGMDALIYVSQVHTDEILFMNDKMCAEFNLARPVEGKLCWQVLQTGQSKRCPNCPNTPLERAEREQITWEERNTVTGRMYRHIGRLIDWKYGQKVNLQMLVDVTDEHEAELALKRRLEQQELMADLSQSFIDTTDEEQQIARALQMAGEFMNIDRVLLIRFADQKMHYDYEWCNPDDPTPSKRHAAVRLNSKELGIAEAFAQHLFAFYRIEGEEARIMIRDYGLDVSTCVLFAVFLEEEFWGVLEFARVGSEEPWSASDINLGEMVAGVLSGVLGRMRMESKLQQLSAIVENAPQFISFLDSQGHRRYLNPAVSALTGFSFAELMAGGMAITYDAETLVRLNEEYLPKVRENGSCQFEAALLCADGQTRIMDYSGFLLSDDPNGDVGVIGVDMTEIRRLERDLIQARDLAEQGSMAKSDFLSRMSHEMRTPMNAIIGMTNIARGSDDPARKEYCLEKIRTASDHLLGVINDILDMSKIEANKFELSSIDFNFERMVGNVVNVISFRTDEKRQKLEVRIDPALPVMLYGDELRLAQVLTNLLTNAAKFTPEEGSILLTAKLLERVDDELRMQFEVTDSGIGISPEQQARLFRSFEQADGGIARKFGGTGLGLAISKRIVELMDGNVWVSSELGKGATFSFTLSLRASHAAPDAEPDVCAQGPLRLVGRRVLLVEDIAINREIVCALLEDTGLTLDTAENGREAIEKVTAAEQPYDLILMDIQMPEVDGLEATRRIRALGDSNAATVPIIAMTANAFREDIERCLEAGMQAHIAKPIELSVLLDTLRSYLA